jgi:LysM repeat protein
LSLMLKRGIEVLVGAVLVVVLLAFLLPTIAEAQEQEAGAAPPRVVVAPGDSLWSISEERLGLGATPQQLAGEVERIYALNQDQIGPDPNLIFPGQKLLLPPVGKKPSAQAPATAQGANETAQKKPAQASLAGHAAKSEIGRDSTATAPGKTSAKTAKAAAPVSERVTLPNVPEATPVPATRPLASNDASRSPVASFLQNVRSAVGSAVGASVGIFAEAREGTSEEWRLLGWGIMALSLLLGALMAWKLPMRRNTWDDYEVWGIPSGYRGRPAHPGTRDGRGGTPKPSTSTHYPTDNGNPTFNDVSLVGLGGIARAKRRTIRNRRARRPRPLPPQGFATGAHAPKVRRSLVRAAIRRARPRMPEAFAHTKAKTTRK